MASIKAFRKATREQLRLRMAIDGPSGSGKTYTALEFAHAMGGRIAVIDTEARSASKYVGVNGWEFDCVDLESFAPSEYAAWIEEAGRQGYDVLVVDSLSHAWEGRGGALDLIDQSSEKNRFTAWKDVTPMHRRMIDAILRSPCHVIVTMRTKTEHILEQDERGKMVPKKVGTAPIQRAGVEYEFDVVADLDLSHILTVSKTRCPSIDGEIVARPTGTFMAKVKDWLEQGVAVERERPRARITDEQMQSICDHAGTLGWPMDRIAAVLPARYQRTTLHDMTVDQAEDLEKYLVGQVRIVKQKRAAKERAAKPETNGQHQSDGRHDPARERTVLITEEKAKEMRRLIAALELCDEVVAKSLAKRGVTEIEELDILQATQMIAALEEKLAERRKSKGAKEPAAATVSTGE